MVVLKKSEAVRVWRCGATWRGAVNGVPLSGEFGSEGAVRGAIKVELRKSSTPSSSTPPDEPVVQPQPQQRSLAWGPPYKLSPVERAIAVSLVQAGRPVTEIARTFNVHPSTIYRCLKAAGWSKEV